MKLMKFRLLGADALKIRLGGVAYLPLVESCVKFYVSQYWSDLVGGDVTHHEIFMSHL